MICENDCFGCNRELLLEVTDPIGDTEVTYQLWTCAESWDEDDGVEHGDYGIRNSHKIKCVLRFKKSTNGVLGWTIFDRPGETTEQLLERARAEVLRSYNAGLEELRRREIARTTALKFRARFSDGTFMDLSAYYHRRGWWVESDTDVKGYGETLEEVLACTQHDLTRRAKMFLVGFEPQ